VEGDSRDDTFARLRAWKEEDQRVLLNRQHIEPVRDFQERVRAWAALGNLAIEAALGQEWDYLLWCESDLCLPPDLITRLVADDRDVVAPAIFLGGMFYDTWGFIGLDKKPFTNEAPYHKDWVSHGLVELGSVGSVVLFRREVLETGIRFQGSHETGLLRGMSFDARAQGFRVWLDSRLAVIHPTTRWERQQYRLVDIALDGIWPTEEANQAFRELAGSILQRSPLRLGSLDVGEDHPAFSSVREALEAVFGSGSVALRPRLVSEGERSFELLMRLKAVSAHS